MSDKRLDEDQRKAVNTFDIAVVAVVGGLTLLGLFKGMVKRSEEYLWSGAGGHMNGKKVK